jgi:hypothetical protein
MEQFKKAQVIMLPTKNNSNIVIINKYNDKAIGTTLENKYLQGGGEFIYNSSLDNSSNPQHLYIVSNDKIKEGDWFINLTNVLKCKAVDFHGIVDNEGNRYDKEISKKIIATTNNSLEIQGDHSTWVENLPQPSQQFIEKYIESYNRGDVITDVLVEYEMKHTGWTEDQSEYTYDEFLKIDRKNNTITIKKLKDSWNREEVINLIKLFANNYPYASNDIGYNKWIEENL